MIAHSPLLRRGCWALLVLASAWASHPNERPYPKIDTSSNTTFAEDTSRALDRHLPPPQMVVPVGGKLMVRLYGECAGYQDCSGNQIGNDKYGYPGIQGQTTVFNDDGWFSFAPTPNHAGHQYDVCSKTDRGGAEFYTCMKIDVRGHRAQFVSNSSMGNNAYVVPADGSVLEATIGRQLEVTLSVDSLIDGGCDFRGYEPWADTVLCPVLKKDSACSCTSAPKECSGSCECMTECPLGPLPVVKALAHMAYPKMDGGLPEGASLTLSSRTPDGAIVTPQVRELSHSFSTWNVLLNVETCFCADSCPAVGSEMASQASSAKCHPNKVVLWGVLAQGQILWFPVCSSYEPPKVGFLNGQPNSTFSHL